ncbi:hypothetical protein BC941DRAFT_417547 [Chlamydoabsidia padenii]|nr:hypothetical protein BC941DRAFT_417547 [Chlamydoabsidia padenii]
MSILLYFNILSPFLHTSLYFTPVHYLFFLFYFVSFPYTALIMTDPSFSTDINKNTTTIYWYSTNGMDRKRLADRHVLALDEAFDRQARVEIFDDEAFKHKSAVASPHLGTMTSGDIHYGLYRQPSLWESNEASLDNIDLVLGSSSNQGNSNNNNRETTRTKTTDGKGNSKEQSGQYLRHSPSNSRNSNSTTATTTTTTTDMRRRQQQQFRGSLDVLCCIIS